MKQMKPIMTLIKSALFIGFFGISMAVAETISGSQTAGGAGKNAELKCAPVKLTSTKKITSVTGSNNGFWIVKDGATTARYHDENDKSAIGQSLPAGTYHIYPNLKQGQKQATVQVKVD